MRKIKFLDNKSPQSLKSFQCLADKIVLVGLDVSSAINLLDVQEFQQILNQSPNDVKVYNTEKKYSKTRELELFEMIDKGCEISNGNLFKNLCLVLPNS